MDSPTIVTIAHEYNKRFNVEYWLVVVVEMRAGIVRYMCIDEYGHTISRFTLSPIPRLCAGALRIFFAQTSWNVLQYPSIENVSFCRRAVITEPKYGSDI